MLSVPHDMTIHDGVERLLDDCNIPPNKAKLLNIDRNPTYINLTYDNSLLFYFKFDKRWKCPRNHLVDFWDTHFERHIFQGCLYPWKLCLKDTYSKDDI